MAAMGQAGSERARVAASAAARTGAATAATAGVAAGGVSVAVGDRSPAGPAAPGKDGGVSAGATVATDGIGF
jgi:hypothetical protein